MKLNLAIDTVKLAEKAGHAVDALDHWLSGHAGEIDGIVHDLLGSHLAGLDVTAAAPAGSTDAGTGPADLNTAPAPETSAGSTGA